jgi:hypothetical protein
LVRAGHVGEPNILQVHFDAYSESIEFLLIAHTSLQIFHLLSAVKHVYGTSMGCDSYEKLFGDRVDVKREGNNGILILATVGQKMHRKI